MQELYITSAVIGFVILMLGILGGDADVDTDTDIDLDAEWLSDALNLKALSAGLIGFGVVGWAIGRAELGTMVTLVIAAIGFIAFMYFAVVLVVRPLRRQQSNTLTNRSSYLSLQAKVTLEIRPDQIGQVELLNSNQVKVTERAKALEPDQTIPKGSEVMVMSVEPGHVVVAAF